MSAYNSIDVGETIRTATVVARADGSPITTGTVNYYLKAKSGANSGKWFRNSDQTWQASETANAMSHDADGHWDITLALSPFLSGVKYVEYVKESADLHVPFARYLIGRNNPVVDSGGRMDLGLWRGSTPASLVDTDKIPVSVQHMAANSLTAETAAADFGAEVAALVEAAIINDADAAAVMQALADKIAADWIAGDASPLAIVAALKADAEWSNLVALRAVADAIQAVTDRLNFNGEDDVKATLDGETVVASNMRGTDGAYTGTPPTAAQIRQEFDANSTQLSQILTDIAAIPAAVWTVATSTLTAAGSIGKLIVDQFTAVLSAISGIAGGAGSGSRAVALKVTDGTDPIQNARIRMQLNAENYLSATNSDGITSPSFGLQNDGEWQVVITADGYESRVETLTVNADIEAGSQVYALTALSIPVPDDPAFVTCVARVKNGATYPANEAVRFQLTKLPAGQPLIDLNDAEKFTSDANGYIHPILLKGATYRYWVGSNRSQPVLIPADAVDGYQLPPLVAK